MALEVAGALENFINQSMYHFKNFGHHRFEKLQTFRQALLQISVKKYFTTN